MGARLYQHHNVRKGIGTLYAFIQKGLAQQAPDLLGCHPCLGYAAGFQRQCLCFRQLFATRFVFLDKQMHADRRPLLLAAGYKRLAVVIGNIRNRWLHAALHHPIYPM